MENASMEHNVKFGLNKLWRWKYWIMGACVASGAISIYLSSKMPDEYKSTAAFVPPSFTSLGTMVFGNGVAYRGFYAADEEDIDRTVAFLESTEVMDSINAKFDLFNHYGIDKAKKNSDKLFYNTFKGNIAISFASNSVVEVECWDTDANYAKEIAEYYITLASNYFERVSQRHEGLGATEKQLLELDVERKMILDSLSSLRSKYLVYHVDHAGDAITAILAKQMMNEPKFNEYYDAVKSMETYISTLELRYGDLMREVMARKLNMEQYPNLLWVTERPSLSKFKDRPKRSIIVILAIMATFVFSSFLAITLDRSRPGEAQAAAQ